MSATINTIQITALADSVLIPVAVKATGLSEKAIRQKMANGVWLEGKEYHKAPDGRIYINLPGYVSWVKSGRASK